MGPEMRLERVLSRKAKFLRYGEKVWTRQAHRTLENLLRLGLVKSFVRGDFHSGSLNRMCAFRPRGTQWNYHRKRLKFRMTHFTYSFLHKFCVLPRPGLDNILA